MDFTVFIPAAGTGSRLGELCRYLNKPLVSVGNRPTICHLIEKFSPTTRFVIALGYKGELLRQFLELAYPDRPFTYVTVSPFEGPGSGLGRTVLSCRDHLQAPFIFCSCDTLVTEAIPPPDENWMGYSEVEDADAYRTIRLAHGEISTIVEKKDPAASRFAYIGLAGIHDVQAFWERMLSDDTGLAIEQGESFGLRALIGSGLRARRFQWFDTGTPESLALTREHFRAPDGPNILPKANEDIWFVGDSVIKFSADQKFIAQRVERSRYLTGFCPEVEGARPNMYRYRRAEGEVLSKIVDQRIFDRLLTQAQLFWRTRSLPSVEQQRFEQVCHEFYHDKTKQRLEQFYAVAGQPDAPAVINGILVPSDATLLAQVDWTWLSRGLPGDFHGDFHFENILYDATSERFTFLDWRQNFGGSLHTGDIYYDLAKLNHGLIVCHELIAQNHFHVERDTDGVRFELLRKQSLVECERQFFAFLENNGYDVFRVKILTALIYLNIAALHHHPYSLLLYYLGKSMLAASLEAHATSSCNSSRELKAS